MDIERIKRCAELIEAKERLMRINLGAEAQLTDLRLLTDPLLVDRWTDMDLTRAEEVMTSLKVKWDEARGLEDRITRLQGALGE